MSTTPHPHGELSAYVDGALTPAERTAVDAHLASCDSCRARLADLRGVASLLAALPDAPPSRRLTPRLAAAPSWMAPMRTLATLASGVCVFLFIASAILANIGFLSARSASTAASGAAAPQAVPAPSALARDRAATAGPSGEAKTTASPGAFAVAASPATPAPPTNAYAAQAPDSEGTRSGRGVGPDPWVWLALAVVTGAIALALQRRVRSS